MSKNTKYTIADVQQEKLVELDMDIKDAFILTYVKEISQLDNLLIKIINEENYFWLGYKKLIEYLPALKISTEDALGRRVAKYEKLGLLKRSFIKSHTRGSLVFIRLEKKFNSLFEINKLDYEDNEIEELRKELGLNTSTDEKPCGQGLKTEWSGTANRVVRDEKPCLNTPNNNTPIKDTSSSTEKTATANFDTFKKSLKTILPDSLKQINGNTVRNIFNYSNKDINAVREALAYMMANNKAMTANVLVAILKDGDYKNTVMTSNKTLSRQGKIEFMTEKLGKDEVNRLRTALEKQLGVKGQAVEEYLGTKLCQRYNRLCV